MVLIIFCGEPIENDGVFTCVEFKLSQTFLHGQDPWPSTLKSKFSRQCCIGAESRSFWTISNALARQDLNTRDTELDAPALKAAATKSAKCSRPYDGSEATLLPDQSHCTAAPRAFQESSFGS